MTARLRLMLACLLAVPAPAALLPLTEEPGLSGTYEDVGSRVEKAGGQKSGEISFHALLRLEFDPLAARTIGVQTLRFVITQTDQLLRIQVYDLDEAVSKESEWKPGRGYVREGDRALLRVRSAPEAKEEYLFILRPVSQGQLLQVEVQHITPTTFGPAFETVGTYVFARLTESGRPK